MRDSHKFLGFAFAYLMQEPSVIPQEEWIPRIGFQHLLVVVADPPVLALVTVLPSSVTTAAPASDLSPLPYSTARVLHHHLLLFLLLR